MANLIGDNNPNTLTGTELQDLIQGLAGDDILTGLGGNDTIEGGTGADIIDGGDGDDILDGGDDADQITTGSGNDTVNGGTGSDQIIVGANLNAADVINGGAGDLDVLSISGVYASAVVLGATTVSGIEFFAIGSGQVRLTLNAATLNGLVGIVPTFNASGQQQTDLFVLDGSAVAIGFNAFGGAGADQLTGGSGNDDLRGGAGQDILVGGAGADRIEGGLDADTLTGGAGNDIFVFGYNTPRSDSSPSTIDIITDFEGAGVAGGDKIDLPSYAYGRGIAFNATAINFTFLGAGVPSGIQLPSELIGDGFADVSWKRDVANNRVEVWVDVDDNGQFSELDLYFYLNGAVSLTQEDFTDTFPVWRGTVGNDTLLASAGNLIGYGLAGNDAMRGGDGNDTLYGGDGIDTIRGGADQDDLRGEAGDDFLYGDAGNDSLNGGAGNDVMDGGV
ncbi:MAG: calcium-binding protein, partial [Caulobacter sp.]|nr:calcium-binding protein [Caulobacter sp.]